MDLCKHWCCLCYTTLLVIILLQFFRFLSLCIITGIISLNIPDPPLNREATSSPCEKLSEASPRPARVSHVTGYPARSRDRSCDRHTVTVTRPSHTAQPPMAGSRAGSCAGSCDESCARLCVGTFDHGNSPRALGPRALSAALGPLAPTATPSLWPVATLSLWPTPFVNHGRWRPSSLGGPRPSALAGLQPTAASGSWGTLGHDRSLGRRRH